MSERFGVTVPTIVKSASEFAAIVSGNPIVPPDTEHSRFLVAFGPDECALQTIHALQPLVQAPDRLAITPLAAYLHFPGGLLESKAGGALLGKAGKGLTTRNWATVLKLAALLVQRAA